MKPLELMEQGRFLGEEMVAWLWYQGQVNGGASGLEGDQSALFMDDSVQLASERGDVKDLSLKKGNPSESREAYEAMSRGMRSYKAKMRLLSGDMEWTFTLASMSLGLSGITMPPSAGKSPHERLHDRIFLLEELYGHIDRRYRVFLKQRSEDPEALCKTLKEWIHHGLKGAIAGDTAPWEEAPE